MQIPFIFSKSMYSFNVEKWINGDEPILFLTGLSGAGKTYMGKALSKQTGALLISFDALKFYKTATLQSKLIVDEFLMFYPEAHPFIEIQWALLNNDIDKKYTEYCIKFYNFIVNRSKHDNLRYIVEGIQLFVRIPWDYFNDKPLYILRTSTLKSFLNVYKRDYSTGKKPRKIHLMVHEFKLYHIEQHRLLNLFISSMFKNHQNRQSIK